jgi:formylglycine-generating enzyme required for sulfatase activity
MKRMSLVLLIALLALAVGCKGGPAPSPEPEASVEVPETMPTVVEILPTPTPVPPPPTPTPRPVPTATPAPEPTEAPTGEAPTEEAPAEPTPTEEIVEEAVEVPMVAIPAGDFTLGSDVGVERPPHSISVGTFEIDMFEVTNEQFAEFVEETGYVTDAEKAGDSTPWQNYAEGKPDHPVVKVSWNDAQAFCEWAGKRLPTEAEWEKAARGSEGFVYPWGNEWATGKANTKEAGHRGTTIVGSFPDGASPYGAMDMAGNVAEWTSDWFQPYPGYPGGDSEAQYFGEKYRVIRGGGWFSDQELVRTTFRSASSVELANDDVGFRCVR